MFHLNNIKRFDNSFLVSPKIKFINSGHMMLFSTKQKTICQLVCMSLNIKGSEQQTYWNLYHKCVEKALNTARNDAVAAMKKSFFKGTAHSCVIVAIDHVADIVLLVYRFYWNL